MEFLSLSYDVHNHFLFPLTSGRDVLTADLTAFKESCRRRIRNVRSDLVLILGREVMLFFPFHHGLYKPGRSARICDHRQPYSSANVLSLERIRRYCER